MVIKSISVSRDGIEEYATRNLESAGLPKAIYRGAWNCGWTTSPIEKTNLTIPRQSLKHFLNL